MASSDILETLELQLSEIELLQSMFPSDGEFELDDPSAVCDLRSFVDDAADGSGLTKYRIPDELAGARGGVKPEVSTDIELISLRQISFLLKVSITAQDGEVTNTEIEVQCSLPLDYPRSLPDLNVQSNTLSRQQYKALNADLKAHLESLGTGELCMTEAIQWLQENASDYLKPDSNSAEGAREVGSVVPDESRRTINSSANFTRLWIHSHHIYSRSKREDICAWARERELTGFSLPGKPGIICVEGPREDVDEFWHKLRRLNWKKLTSKHREDFTAPSHAPSDSRQGRSDATFKQHFTDFQEINFDVRGSRDYHMDLGQFFQYLEQHGCADIFKILLGVDGRVSQKGTS